MEKTTVFIDMDGVIVDFKRAINDQILDLVYDSSRFDFMDFSKMKPLKGAIKSVKELYKHPNLDVYILSTASWNNSEVWKHKMEWVNKYLPFMKKRLILSHNKHLCCRTKNDIIIDDRLKNGVEKWEGIHIHFGQKGFKNWKKVIKYFNKLHK